MNRFRIAQTKAYLIYGEGGFKTQIALYKKPNRLLIWFLWLLGVKVEIKKEGQR